MRNVRDRLDKAERHFEAKETAEPFRYELVCEETGRYMVVQTPVNGAECGTIELFEADGSPWDCRDIDPVADRITGTHNAQILSIPAAYGRDPSSHYSN